MFSFEFRLDANVQYFNRSIYTGLDLIGDIGGLFDGLKGFGSLIVSLYFSICGDPMSVFLLSSVFIKDTRNMNEKKAPNRLQEALEQIKGR